MPQSKLVAQSVFALCALTVLLWTSVSGGSALLLGMIIALTLGNPWVAETKKRTPMLLQFSVVGLGGATNLITVGQVGQQGILYTAVGIGFTLLLGQVLGKWLRIEPAISVLLSAGTAICGGSAIAAVAPVIRARDHEISVSLATVFLLNAAALFLFPWIGHLTGLSQDQFGLWSALAIHDTSSVVGASMQYGPRALEVATTVKLTRALWIVPMTFVIGWVWNRAQGTEAGSVSSKKPWFILGFLLMSAVTTFVPAFAPVGQTLAVIARRALVLTLFLIGSGLSPETLRKVGPRPFVFGVVLWVIVGSASYVMVSVGN